MSAQPPKISSKARRPPLKAVIVGGSQAGLMTAIALRSIGIEVAVHERSSRPLEDRGAGIRLHPSLLEVLSARTDIDISLFSCEVERQQYLGKSGEVLHTEPARMVFSSWGSLFRALRDAVPDSVYHLGSKCIGYREGDGEALACFEGGRTEEADLVVFADGIGSIGREQLAVAGEPKYAGYVVWRGCVSEEQLNPEYRALLADAHTTCLLDHSHINLYLVPRSGEAPVEGRRLVNFVWYRNVPDGSQLERILVDRGGVKQEISIPPGRIAKEIQEELRASAAELLPVPAAEVVRLCELPFMQVVYDLEVFAMASDRACLIGDAGFVARPHLGAGTGKAAVNAWALADSIDGAAGDIGVALRDWEQRELSLGWSIVHRSRLLGERLQFMNNVVPGDADVRDMVAAPLRAPAEARSGR